MCRALLNAPMREGQEGDVDIKDVRKPVFQALLYFTYTDQLPEVSNLLHCLPSVGVHASVIINFLCNGQARLFLYCCHACQQTRCTDSPDRLVICHQQLVHVCSHAPQVVRLTAFISMHFTSSVQQLVTHKHTAIVELCLTNQECSNL